MSLFTMRVRNILVFIFMLLVTTMTFGLPTKSFRKTSSAEPHQLKVTYNLIRTPCQEGYIRISGKCVKTYDSVRSNAAK
jgi:hypothetical protein